MNIGTLGGGDAERFGEVLQDARALRERLRQLREEGKMPSPWEGDPSPWEDIVNHDHSEWLADQILSRQSPPQFQREYQNEPFIEPPTRPKIKFTRNDFPSGILGGLGGSPRFDFTKTTPSTKSDSPISSTTYTVDGGAPQVAFIVEKYTR